MRRSLEFWGLVKAALRLTQMDHYLVLHYLHTWIAVVKWWKASQVGNERVWKEELKEEEGRWRGLSRKKRGLGSSWTYIDYLKFQEQKFRPRKRPFGRDLKPRGLRSDWWLFNLCSELRECLCSQRNDWEESRVGEGAFCFRDPKRVLGF